MEDINKLIQGAEEDIKKKQEEILSKVDPKDLQKTKDAMNEGLNEMLSKNKDPLVRSALNKMIIK